MQDVRLRASIEAEYQWERNTYGADGATRAVLRPYHVDEILLPARIFVAMLG